MQRTSNCKSFSWWCIHFKCMWSGRNLLLWVSATKVKLSTLPGVYLSLCELQYNIDSVTTFQDAVMKLHRCLGEIKMNVNFKDGYGSRKGVRNGGNSPTFTAMETYVVARTTPFLSTLPGVYMSIYLSVCGQIWSTRCNYQTLQLYHWEINEGQIWILVCPTHEYRVLIYIYNVAMTAK